MRPLRQSFDSGEDVKGFCYIWTISRLWQGTFQHPFVFSTEVSIWKLALNRPSSFGGCLKLLNYEEPWSKFNWPCSLILRNISAVASEKFNWRTAEPVHPVSSPGAFDSGDLKFERRRIVAFVNKKESKGLTMNSSTWPLERFSFNSRGVRFTLFLLKSNT